MIIILGVIAEKINRHFALAILYLKSVFVNFQSAGRGQLDEKLLTNLIDEKLWFKK